MARMTQKKVTKSSGGGNFLLDRSQLLANCSTFINNSIAIIASVLALLGITANVAPRAVPAIDLSVLATASLPMRAVIFLIIASGLGWGLGSFVNFAVRRKSDALGFTAYIAAIVWAGLMVGTADWLSADTGRSALPILTLFTIVGVGTVFKLLSFQFRATGPTATGTLPAARVQSTVILMFSIASLVFLVLTDLGEVL